MDSVCSHEGGPLEEGTLENYALVCPWHQGVFDIRTAKASPDTDWVTDLKSYTVIVDETSGQLQLILASGDQSMNNGEKNTSQKDEVTENMQTRPSKRRLKLINKILYKGTDIMSFKFSRNDDNRKSQDYRLNYEAGQYAIVDLETKEDPEGPVRSFTLASSPTDKESILISTRIRNSSFKKKLESLNVGQLLSIIAPLGKFVLYSDYSRPAVFLSGGIGVTPFRRMIKYATDRQLPINISMFYSNRNQNNILYKEEFDEWTEMNKNLKIIYTLTDGETEAQMTQASQPESKLSDDIDWRLH
jgi:ferredoxin-NADP reductase